MLKKIIKYIILIIVVLGLLYVLYPYFFTTKSSQTTPAPLLSVKVVPLKVYTLPQTVTSYGNTISPKSVPLTAEITGRIMAVKFTNGQIVNQGQLLFQLQSSDVGKTAGSLKLQMMQDLSYYQRLDKIPDTVSKYDLLKAHTAYLEAKVSYQTARRMQNIRAPISGKITATDITKGSRVILGTSLATIVDQKSLQVEYSVPSQYASLVKTGQKIEFTLGDSLKTYSGVVVYVSPHLNKNDYNLDVRAKLTNAPLLRPNLFGTVLQTLNPRYKTLAVPQNIVQTDAKGFFVYTVNKQQEVVQMYFTPGFITAAGLIQVKSGLTVNTPIVTTHLSALRSGKKVKVMTK